jgi:CubicO group peptidase (beta-lactamase class C family)
MLLAACALPVCAQLAPATQKAIDEAVLKTLAEKRVPSASVAIVKDGKLAYTKAYGDARLDPKMPAQASMRYKIGSNSKQLTASAILLLAEQGKASLDDPVSKYLPAPTRAHDVTIRELLSHESGYQDFYAIDFIPPFMTRETNPEHILDVWAGKPLDFEPGTQYQYSNTNYVIAGLIVEKITGAPLIDFLRARVFEPLGMRSPIDADREKWSADDPAGYTHYALGPARPVASEGPGWLSGAGELAMTASDLARWDIALMNGEVLKPESLRELTTENLLKNGAGSHYALGLSIGLLNGHRVWAHTGGTSGFVSANTTYPDDRASITVLTNGEGGAATPILRRIQALLIAPAADPNAARDLDRARGIFLSLQEGKLDRSLLDSDTNAYFTGQAIADFAASLKPLGALTGFMQDTALKRGGMTYRTFAAHTKKKNLTVAIFVKPDGKIAQYLIEP